MFRIPLRFTSASVYVAIVHVCAHAYVHRPYNMQDNAGDQTTAQLSGLKPTMLASPVHSDVVAVMQLVSYPVPFLEQIVIMCNVITTRSGERVWVTRLQCNCAEGLRFNAFHSLSFVSVFLLPLFCPLAPLSVQQKVSAATARRR